MENDGINEEKKLWSSFKGLKQPSRSPCVDDNSMAAYLEGKPLLMPRSSIEEHLAACPACLEKLVQMRSLLAIEIQEAPLAMKQKAKDHVAEDIQVHEESVFDWLKLVFQPSKSLAWGIMLLFIVTTGVRSAEAINLSPGSFIGSASDILGLDDNTGI